MSKDLQQVFYAALRSAINKVLRMCRTEANRALREHYRLSKADIDKVMTMKLSSGKNFTGELIVGGQQFKLYAFPSRQLRAGVKVTITKGMPKTLTHTFIATMQSGHTGIFERKGDKVAMKSGRYRGQKRQQIKELTGPAIADLFAGKKIVDRLEAIVKEKLPETFAHEFEYYRGRWNV